MLLKQHQAWLNANNSDIMQMIIWFDNTESSIKQRALQLVIENTEDSQDKFKHWAIEA